MAQLKEGSTAGGKLVMTTSGSLLEDYKEKIITLSGTSPTINLSSGSVFSHSLTGNTVYTMTNIGEHAQSFTLILNQPTTVRTVTFSELIKWQGGEIPDLTEPNKTYVLTFMTVDGGTTWLGMYGGEF